MYAPGRPPLKAADSETGSEVKRPLVKGTQTLESLFQTQAGIEEARDRLGARSAASLADFILSLAQNEGPVGDHVRTFIVSDDVPYTVSAIRERIAGLEPLTEYAQRHAESQQIGTRLELILDSIEHLLLPVECAAAFEMLATLFEADAKAMENCDEDDREVTCAYKRAAHMMGIAAQFLPPETVADKISELIANDGYGVRAALESLLESADRR